MALDLSVVGSSSDPVERSWTSTDAILYALGVGAGQDDPLGDLAFTTENSAGVEQRVLPTYAVVLVQTAGRGALRIGDYDPAMLVHAEQAVTLHRPLPVEGTLSVTSTVTGIHDKGSGALVVTESRATDASTGEALATTRSSAFIRGAGGFGGDRGPSETWQAPEGKPDVHVDAPTREDQALLYRLSGDRNPLHSDPSFAARAGFARPILHGLCTYGVTGRVLLSALCGGDPERFRSMRGRFTRPVLPGDTLTVEAWTGGPAGEARFRTSTSDGSVVLDRGVFTFSPA